MKKSNGLKTSKLACLIVGICCVLPNVIAGDIYTIDHYVISGGGGSSSGGSYMVQGSIGQPISSKSSASIYALSSGFWQEDTDLIFRNSFE